MNPEPPALPAAMVGAYVTFLKSLSDAHGVSVSPGRYLRLCLDAEDAPVRFLEPPRRARILLQIGTKTVSCVYDHVGKVLLKALPETHPCLQHDKRQRSQPKGPEGKVHPSGVRRKKLHREKKVRLKSRQGEES